MLTITQRGLVEALGISKNTASTRLTHLPHDGNRPRRYDLAKVLPTTKWREFGGLNALFTAAESDGSLFVGDDAREVADLLCNWMDPVMKGRAVRVQKSFVNAVAACRSQVLFEHMEDLRMSVLIHGTTLPFIATGDARGLPAWQNFAPAFALVNAPATTQLAA